MSFVSAAKKLPVLALLAALSALAQGAYKVEPAPAPPAPELSQALAATLAPKGVRLVNDQAAAVGELWLRNSIPTLGNSGGSGDVIYGRLTPGSFLGVLHFPNQGSDFRGQRIPAGYYTLRYALIPTDGNHLGVSTYRDFILLAPVAADTQLDQALSFDALVSLSRKASGSGHPAVLSLDPPTETKNLPAAVRDDQGHWAVDVQLHGKSGDGEKDFPMAIVLVGKTEAE